MLSHRLPLLAALLSLTLSAYAFGPTTKANDDSCDIALLPAATLLVPYFEVDLDDPTNETTLLSLTNVTKEDRIARVTLWTDFSYPVFTFNLQLDGYEVRSISLYDVLRAGVIDGADGSCGSASLSEALLARIQHVLTLGSDGTCHDLGRVHERAVGYATIDVVGNCSTAMPTDAEYFANDIRYDNVLVGDYQQVSVRKRIAQSSPMVHIRAIPEGGTPATRKADPASYANRFSQTFYSRFQPAGMFNSDARQPLPSRFVSRWIRGAESMTEFRIWRQSAVGRDIACGSLSRDELFNVADVVMFDADENAEGLAEAECEWVDCGPVLHPKVRSTMRVAVADTDVFPSTFMHSRSVGWVYLNLDDTVHGNGAGQAWVVTTMTSGFLSGTADAIALGNGCSPAVGLAEQSVTGTAVIGPSPNGEPEP